MEGLKVLVERVYDFVEWFWQDVVKTPAGVPLVAALIILIATH